MWEDIIAYLPKETATATGAMDAQEIAGIFQLGYALHRSAKNNTEHHSDIDRLQSSINRSITQSITALGNDLRRTTMHPTVDLGPLSQMSAAILANLSRIESAALLVNDGRNKPAASNLRGQQGEAMVKEILSRWEVVTTGHQSKTGDFIVEGKILVEVKNYTDPVPSVEVEKFKRDLSATGMAAGLFVSISSSIAGFKTSFDRRFQLANGRQVPTVYLCCFDNPEAIELAVELLLAELKDAPHALQPINFDQIHDQIETLAAELTTLGKIRGQLSDAAATIGKTLSGLYENVTAFEVRTREMITVIRRDLALTGPIDAPPSANIIDLLANYPIKDRANVIAVCNKITGGEWRGFKNRIDHTSGRTLFVAKTKCELGVDMAAVADLAGILRLNYVMARTDGKWLKILIGSQTMELVDRVLGQVN